MLIQTPGGFDYTGAECQGPVVKRIVGLKNPALSIACPTCIDGSSWVSGRRYT
jgi:hypothetical protein